VESLLAAARAIEEAGIAIDDLGVHRPSLDDVFLALTGRGAEQPELAESEAEEGPKRRFGRKSKAA
jgi:ABC-2 type transport system ATP-binding protein